MLSRGAVPSIGSSSPTALGSKRALSPYLPWSAARNEMKIPDPMAPEPRHRSDPTEAIQGTDLAASLVGVRVLLVEDDPDARAFVARVLTDAQAAVVAVASGFEGLLALASRRPHVIVSDIGMPGLDGFAFLEEVRRREEARGLAPVPAIALTAYDDTAHIARAGSAGFQRHLAKPVDTDRLLVAVAEAAGRDSPKGRRPGPA